MEVIKIEFSENIKYDNNGLIPAIAQDHITKEVLMLAYMNEESLKMTLETKRACYYSRSRERLWTKGETSGHYQNIKEIKYDCDCDTLLLIVEQIGVACHTGNKSCFFNTAFGENIQKNVENAIFEVYNIVNDRKENPKEKSYTNYLFEKGSDKILKKVGEETAEVIIATKNSDRDEIIYETSDLIYHLTVNLVNMDITWDEIFIELKKRMKD